jgi:hypothetical protein
VAASAVEVINGDQDLVSGHDLGDSNMATRGQVDDVNTPVALKRAKPRKPRSRKVLDFTALKRAKRSNKGGQPHLPARGQADTEWLKSILPAPKTGAWWETPPNDKGFLIKLRWRAGGKKPVYPFARLGKRELEKLMEKTYDEQKRYLSGRIFRKLYRDGARAVAARITPYAGDGEIASGLSA